METDLLLLWRFIWRQRRVLIIAVSVMIIVALVWVWRAPRIYTATVTILPSEDSDNVDVLSKLTMMTGGLIAGGGAHEDLYGEIILSRAVLSQLINKRWRYGGREDVSLYEIFGVLDQESEPGEPEERKLEKALRERCISFHRDRNTGFMSVEVRVPGDPDFCSQFANALARQLDDYNKSYKSARAREQRVFIEQQLRVSERRLEAAQDSLTRFMEHNRNFADSPVLSEKATQLRRIVDAQAAVWTDLMKQYEMARIEENKHLSSLNILDRAVPPLKPSSPRVRLSLFLAILFGLSVGVAIGIYREQGHQQ